MSFKRVTIWYIATRLSIVANTSGATRRRPYAFLLCFTWFDFSFLFIYLCSFFFCSPSKWVDVSRTAPHAYVSQRNSRILQWDRAVRASRMHVCTLARTFHMSQRTKTQLIISFWWQKNNMKIVSRIRNRMENSFAIRCINSNRLHAPPVVIQDKSLNLFSVFLLRFAELPNKSMDEWIHFRYTQDETKASASVCLCGNKTMIIGDNALRQG